VNKPHKIRRITGLVLHVLIAAFVGLAGSMKLLFASKELVEMMDKYGLGDKVRLLGAGEVVTAILLVVPLTSSLGVLLMSGFWGGVICIHMSHHEPYVTGAVMLLLTWLGAFLREPGTFASFFRREPAVSGPPEAAS
jgi:NADH:ubiquinone oxidoreductase subunit 2 (subunit N)